MEKFYYTPPECKGFLKNIFSKMEGIEKKRTRCIAAKCQNCAEKISNFRISNKRINKAK